ncbi:FKBP-type peptidyl-prolyl cis-trans isomerase [Rhodopirellula sp.]|jgi:FKBP-type peptidyl-prolyl cis-trans isomerase FklB|nr:FKBP-type peptidyl-prolyl cis-trans isomerase [Rhodopirellula sp.]MDA9776959.1 FKBP-type peptidyl-prolyl cis-trans isomerase [Rubripirellula sp.]
MLNRFSLFGTFLLQLALIAPAIAQAPEGNTVKDPLSYFLGISVGQQMGQSGFQLTDLDVNQLLLGFQDGIQGKPPALTEEQLTEARAKIQTLLQARQQQQQAEMEKAGAANREKGVQFLAENAKKEGVKSIDGGIQYKEITAGSGDSPKATDTVRVHYTGTLIDGTKFDSSVDRGQPATFPLNRVIQGWQIAIAKMKVGGKWIIYIPSDLAYGAQGSPSGGIGPNEVLIFEVELLGIE